MSQRKRRRYRPAPPPPPDAQNYILVRTREGSFWRRKRGTVKKTELNKAFQKNVETTALASPIARRIKDKLEEFLKGLDTGRFIANVSARLKKTYNRTGEWNFSLLEDYDLQPDRPMGNLLKKNYFLTGKKGELTIHIYIDSGTVKRHNQLVTDYYFDAILLYGDPSKKNSLRIESETSPLYTIGGELETECSLSIILPVKKLPWMVLLKLSCLEGNEPARHPNHYGMKVVKVGVGILR